MKKILLLSFGCLIALPTLLIGQDNAAGVVDKVVNEAVNNAKSTYASEDERKFAIVEYFDKVAPMDSFLVTTLVTDVQYITDKSVTYRVTPADTAVLYISQDGRPLIATMTWKYADQRYDTTFTEKEKIDDAASGRWGYTNMVSYKNPQKPGIYQNTFTAVLTTASPSSAKLVTTCDAFEFYSEDFQGHGWVKVFADGQQVYMTYQGNAPYGTDYGLNGQKMVPTYRYVFPKATPTSPAKEHTIEFKTDANNQYIIDFVRTLNYTLKPR